MVTPSGNFLKDEHGVLADVFGGRNVTFHSTIARSDTPLDEEWVNQGHEDAMDFLIKKYSSEKLKRVGTSRDSYLRWKKQIKQEILHFLLDKPIKLCYNTNTTTNNGGHYG